MDAKKEQLLRERRQKLRDAQDAHYHKAASLNTWRYVVGIPVVLFTVFVGSALFSDLQTSDSQTVNIVMGIIAVLTAVLASVQTFLKFPERANIHRLVAVELGFLKKDMDELIAMPPKDETELDEKMAAIRKKWDGIISEAPTIPNGLWKRVKKTNMKEGIINVNPTSAGTTDKVNQNNG